MTTPLEGSRILVVDDNQVNVELLVSLLKRADYELMTAESGAEALALVVEMPPDLILLDINMPEMNGYEVCEQLKANPDTADIPVIFISALQETENILRGFEVGGVDYIGKPFKYREVLARVNTQLSLYHQRKEIEAMRQRDNEQAALMDSMRKQFIGSATHDLKNPLFVISGYTDMLNNIPAVADSDEAQVYMDAIKRGTEKMNALVRDMLDLLRMEGENALTLQEVSLATFVEKQATDMLFSAAEKDISLAIDVTDDATVHIDSRQMARVMDNLISNAIKYTPDGGNVAVSTVSDEATASIIVDDDGLGIPEAALETLFTPFERVKTDAHLAQDGTGLGLSIVKAIVEQHGGHIEVDSTLGEGSRFRVWLPR